MATWRSYLEEHTVGLPDEKGATMQALRTRFRARVGLGLHDRLMIQGRI